MVLKKEVDELSGASIRLVINGATEAHLLAEEIGKANVGVLLTPPRPLPMTWDARRGYELFLLTVATY